MTWRRVAGRWNVVKGRVREALGRLLDDDAEVVAGRRDQLIGHIQELYAWSRDDAERRADRLLGSS